MTGRSSNAGFTLVEALLAIAFGALVLTTMTSVLSQLGTTRQVIEEQDRLTRSAQYAMERMIAAVRQSPQLVLPQVDKPATNWRDNVREETVPASAPESGSFKATAVLAVALGPRQDLDADGFADADNDRDGRINEDFPADITNDNDPGVHAIDDGGDGFVDEGFFANRDDDERLSASDEDPINGVDDDGDGQVDEDPGADMNNDGAPGVAGLDDDGDGQIDEGSSDDDDEDGSEDEDWLDVVVFYLDGDTLIERRPVPWDQSGDTAITGRDFLALPIADGLTLLRFERLVTAGRFELVEISMTITGAGGQSTSLVTRARVGGGL